MADILDWLETVMRTLGAPGVGAATALETVFPPLPSEVVLPLAGYTASQGHYGLLTAIVWATVGSLLGSYLLYYAGAALGVTRLARIADRLPLVHAADVHRAVTWFDRHGRTAILLGRLVPGVRSLISIPAGVSRMPLAQFTLYTVLGSTVWNALLIGAGYQLAEQWSRIETFVGGLSNLVYAGIAVALAAFVVHRLRSGTTRRSAEESG